MDQQDEADIIAVMEARMAATMEETVKRMRAFEQEARRFDKIEEDVATLAEHIGEIRRTLGEIAAG